VVGTLAYMAPEVIQGRDPTTAIDLYAVGVIAYEIFCGRHPFDTENAQKLLQDVLFSNPDLTTIYSSTSHLPKAQPLDTIMLDDAYQTLPLDNFQTANISEMETVIYDDNALPITQPATPTDNIDFIFTDTDDVTTLAGIVGKLLAKSPDERYNDSDRVIADLTAALRISIPPESAAIRESFLQAATFVGREAELNRLDQALAEAMQGSGSAWLIAGVSGVGKSRLIEEVRIRALVQGIVVLRGEAVADGGLPYQLWREPLRRLVLTSNISDLDASILMAIIPDIDDLLGRPITDAVVLEGDAHQRRLFGAIANLFQNQTQPTMLILEDLQWSSESLEVVKLLYGIAPSLPLLIVGNYRHEERPTLPQDLPGMQVMRLERLTPADIANLSVSMLGEAGRQSDVLDLLKRETEGNVFFLVEVVRALAEEAGGLGRVGSMSLPANVLAGGIQTIIRRRLERVPENGRRLLQLAAISGRQIDLGLLEEVKGDLDLTDWLTTCVNSAVLDVQDDRYRFAHDKLREATIAAIPTDVAADFHRQIAEALEQVYPDAPEQATVLAQHWRAAGDVENEFYQTQAAGDYALRISALSEAIAHFERCQELLPLVMTGDNQRQSVQAELYVKLGEALQYSGSYSEAEIEIAEGLKLYQALNDQVGSAHALSLRGDNYWRTGNYEAALQACSESFALYRVLHYPDGEARTLNRLGMVAFEQGDYPRANEQIQAALAVAEASQNRVARATSLNNLGLVALRQGNYADAVHYFEVTLNLHRENGERWKVASTLHNLGTLAGIQGSLERADQNFNEALQMCRTIGDKRGIALALDNLGFVAQLRGELDKATTYLEESLSLAQAIGNRQGSANTLLNLGHVASAQHDIYRAGDLFRQALRIAHEIDATPMMLESIGGLANLRPNDPQALAWLGMVLNQPATTQETRDMATKTIDQLKATQPAESVDAAIAAGKDFPLEQVIKDILG
nr:tetratricopeptide repeat protein [Anaerolineae bacterium]